MRLVSIWCEYFAYFVFFSLTNNTNTKTHTHTSSSTPLHLTNIVWRQNKHKHMNILGNFPSNNLVTFSICGRTPDDIVKAMHIVWGLAIFNGFMDMVLSHIITFSNFSNVNNRITYTTCRIRAYYNNKLPSMRVTITCYSQAHYVRAGARSHFVFTSESVNSTWHDIFTAHALIMTVISDMKLILL